LFDVRVFGEIGTYRFIAAINPAIEELARDRSAMSLVQANWEVCKCMASCFPWGMTVCATNIATIFS